MSSDVELLFTQFINHIDIIYGKALCVLWFIKRNCSDLKNINHLKVYIAIYQFIYIP